MISGQLLPNGVTDGRVLDALRRIPREKFVSPGFEGVAYMDDDIAIGGGRYLPDALVLARLLQAGGLRPSDVVLDIGCGTGYAMALMAGLAGTVVGLDTDAAMLADAESRLRDLEICNAVTQQRDVLRSGYAAQGPYNIIHINGSVRQVPASILDQLADGGRLLTVRSNHGHIGTAILVTRRGPHFAVTSLFDAAVPALAGFETSEAFVF